MEGVPRRIIPRLVPARVRYGMIRQFAKLNCWYSKGIGVLSFIRNMEITDIGILMAVVKYFFGDQISNTTIITAGACYWVFNTFVNVFVGWTWEHHKGWEIEAQERAKRVDPTRTVLVDPKTGRSYGLVELREIFKETSGPPEQGPEQTDNT